MIVLRKKKIEKKRKTPKKHYYGGPMGSLDAFCGGTPAAVESGLCGVGGDACGCGM